jgi:hypothetical protein
VPTGTTEAAKVDLELRAWTNFKLGSDRAITRREIHVLTMIQPFRLCECIPLLWGSEGGEREGLANLFLKAH